MIFEHHILVECPTSLDGVFAAEKEHAQRCEQADEDEGTKNASDNGGEVDIA